MGANLKTIWLGKKIVDELEMASGFWEMSPQQRRAIHASPDLESMYTYDGSNLRVQVDTNLNEGSKVQLREFLPTDPEDPIEAIVSDSATSVTVGFAEKVLKQFEARWKRPLRSRHTRGAIIHIRHFEIVVPEFSSTDDNPVSLLVTDCDYLQSGGSPLYGQPTPVQDLPEMKRLLRNFHKNKSGAHSDTNIEYGDDLLSQGTSSEVDNEEYSQEQRPTGRTAGGTSQTQLGTQVAYSQAAFSPNRGGVLDKKIKTETTESIETSERLNARQKPPPKKSPRKLLALLGPSRQSPMPPPPPPNVHSRPSQTPQAKSQSLVKEVQPAEEIDNLIEEPVPANSFHEDDDTIVTQGGGDEVEDEAGPETVRPVRDVEMVDDINGPDQTPTSYQIPVVSSSTVPTTNSSMPSAVQSGEKDSVVEPSQKRKQPFVYHASWNCVLPATRSVCRIPKEQYDLLKKSASLLPSPIGCRFPVGNVPTVTLMNITEQAEERSRKAQTATNNDGSTEMRAEIVDDALPTLDVSPPDAIDDDLLGSQPPSPTQEVPWSSSPVAHLKCMADLPPDSSLPEEQATTPPTRPERTEKAEALPPKSPEIPSSPPTTSSHPDARGNPLDEAESDLEMSVPTAYTQTKQARTNLQKPKASFHGSSNNGQNPRKSTKRDISSAGQKYTNLHQPEDEHPQSIPIPSPSMERPATQRPQIPTHENGHTSLPTSAIPCSIEASQPSPNRTPRKIVGFDGAAESRIQVLPDEDTLIERQIQNEINNQSSRRQSLTTAPVRGRSPLSSPLDRNRGAMEREASAGERSPARRFPKNLSTKREAFSPSPPGDSRKRAKKSHTNYHFSQDSPFSQTPTTHLREQRRQFHLGIEQREPIDTVEQSSPLSRRASISTIPGLALLESGSPSAQNNNLVQHSNGPPSVMQEPNEHEQSLLSPSQQPSSHVQHSGSLEVNSPIKSKAEIHGGDAVPLEADGIPHADSHDAMDVDVPTQEPSQTPRFESAVKSNKPFKSIMATPKEQNTNIEMSAKARKSLKKRIEWDLLKLHRRQPSADGTFGPDRQVWLREQKRCFEQAKKHNIVLQQKIIDLCGDKMIGSSGNQDEHMNTSSDGSDVEVDWEASSSVDFENELQAAASSSSTKMVLPAPQTLQEDHKEPNDVGPSLAKQTSAVSSPQERADAPRGASRISNPDDVFERFSGAYPEYTGNRVHFENLCGQINWLRTKQPLHPFLWDDYIVRSRLDYRRYTEKCTNEGIDPLPWYKYYVEEIPMPEFNKGIVNPTVLQNLLDGPGKALKPVVHANVPRVEQVLDRGPPPKATPRSDNHLQGGASYRADHPQAPQRTGANNIPIGPQIPKRANKRQRNSNASPIRHPSRQATAPPAAPLSTSYPFNTTRAPSVALPPPHAPAQAKPASSPAKTVPAPASKIARPIPHPATNRLNSTPARAASVAAMPAPQPSAAASRTLSGMPLPPPPLSKNSKESGKQMNFIQAFKKRYEKPRPGGSRAGSAAP